MKTTNYFTLISLLCLISAPVLSLRCTDFYGKSVDWFIALRMKGSNKRRVYLVMTSEDKNWNFANEEELIYPLLE
jgi:hypothetical protein